MRGQVASILRRFRLLKRTRPEVRPLPASLCHFYRYSNADHLDWLEPVIVNHEIYVPTAKQLNDPRDGKPLLANIPVKRIAAFVRRDFKKKYPGAESAFYRSAWEGLNLTIEQDGADETLKRMSKHLHAALEDTRVFSMSKRWDNLSLWAKYADNHRGYCLEFAREGLFDAAREVVYDDSLRLDVGDDSHLAFDWFFYKSPEWSN
jgi:hypothetical protein